MPISFSQVFLGGPNLGAGPPLVAARPFRQELVAAPPLAVDLPKAGCEHFNLSGAHAPSHHAISTDVLDWRPGLASDQQIESLAGQILANRVAILDNTLERVSKKALHVCSLRSSPSLTTVGGVGWQVIDGRWAHWVTDLRSMPRKFLLCRRPLKHSLRFVNWSHWLERWRSGAPSTVVTSNARAFTQQL